MPSQFIFAYAVCSPTVHSWTLALTIYPSSNEPSRQQLDHPSGSKACIALNTKILNHIYKQGNGLISHTHSIITIQPNHLTHSIITIQPSHLTAVILKSWQKLNKRLDLYCRCNCFFCIRIHTIQFWPNFCTLYVKLSSGSGSNSVQYLQAKMKREKKFH